jgi:hypothetical protein
MTTDGNQAVDWATLASRIIYPTKVHIIEAICRIGQPLSASGLEQVFEQDYSLSGISYHVKTLVKLGVLTEVRKRPFAAAWERFYFFAPGVLTTGADIESRPARSMRRSPMSYD